MSRQKKIEKIKRSDKVSKISDLEAIPNCMHPDYQSEPCDCKLTETGSLEVLKVVPKSGDGPSFVARWDQRPEELDIDMHGASKRKISDFKE